MVCARSPNTVIKLHSQRPKTYHHNVILRSATLAFNHPSSSKMSGASTQAPKGSPNLVSTFASSNVHDHSHPLQIFRTKHFSYTHYTLNSGQPKSQTARSIHHQVQRFETEKEALLWLSSRLYAKPVNYRNSPAPTKSWRSIGCRRWHIYSAKLKAGGKSWTGSEHCWIVRGKKTIFGDVGRSGDNLSRLFWKEKYLYHGYLRMGRRWKLRWVCLSVLEDPYWGMSSWFDGSFIQTKLNMADRMNHPIHFQS